MTKIDIGEVRGDPTEEELAAIMAAVEMTWPRGVIGADDEPPLRWRFSGRWWTKPMPLRRERPW